MYVLKRIGWVILGGSIGLCVPYFIWMLSINSFADYQVISLLASIVIIGSIGIYFWYRKFRSLSIGLFFGVLSWIILGTLYYSILAACIPTGSCP
jgi:hypothetical protein